MATALQACGGGANRHDVRLEIFPALAAIDTLAFVSGFFPLQCRVTLLAPLSQCSPPIVTYGVMMPGAAIKHTTGALTNAQNQEK